MKEFGGMHNGICAIHLKLQAKVSVISKFRSYDNLEKDTLLKGIVFAPMWEKEMMLWYGKEKTNQVVKDTFVEMIQQFLIDIPKNKMEVLKKVA